MKKKLHMISSVICIVMLCVALCFAFAGCSKTSVQLQNELGALLEGGGFEKGSSLVTDLIETAGEKGQEIISLLEGQNYDKDGEVSIYDIFVAKDGKEVQPNEKVKITLPAPFESESGYITFHIRSNNIVEALKTVYENGNISFETDSFSTFVVTPKDPEATAAKSTLRILFSGDGGNLDVLVNGVNGVNRSIDSMFYENQIECDIYSDIMLWANIFSPETHDFIGWYRNYESEETFITDSLAYNFLMAEEEVTIIGVIREKSQPSYCSVSVSMEGSGGSINCDSYHITVTAVWENIPVVTYTVSFDSNGGTGTMADVTGISGEYTLPANGFTAPDGKQFKAWSVDGVEKAVGSTINVTANTTVTAVWENIPVVTYTVSFAANGGTGTMADVTGVSGEYTLPANGFTAPDGKQFKAWSVGGSEKAVGSTINVTANTTVTAVWENIPVVTYTVSFAANGGTGTMADVTGISGEYTLPANGFTAPAGKQFKAWSVGGVEKAAGDKITVTANTTVTAVWENIPAATYKVTVTNGTGGGNYAAGATVSITANAAPADKVFDKWEVVSGSITLADATSATTTFTMPAGAVSVKATYKAAPHTHSYSTDWKTDTDKHWHECSCGDKSEEAAHTAGEWITDTAATATTDGTKHKECTVCGYVMETATIPATGIEHTHNYSSDWKTDADKHWNECECGDKANTAPHADENNDGKCDICGYAMGNAENPGGDKEPEKTGLSGGAIVGIAIGSILVAVLGGFAIFWFVIKKKKFADLIALFKKK